VAESRHAFAAMSHTQQGAVQGLALSVATLLVVWTLPRPVALDLLAVLLGVIAGVYVGFAIHDGRTRAKIVEGIGVAVFLGFAMMGLWSSPHWLAAGYFLHILWDYAHHPRAIPTKTVAWYPTACLVYDGLLGAYILYTWW
jgi:hypothetical protein